MYMYMYIHIYMYTYCIGNVDTSVEFNGVACMYVHIRIRIMYTCVHVLYRKCGDKRRMLGRRRCAGFSHWARSVLPYE